MKILNSNPPYNLFGLEGQDYDKSKVVAVPVPYDSTTTYRSGTREGPRALIEASRNIELYSEETESDISKIGIFTTEEVAPDFSSPENMVKRIEREVDQILDDKKVPFLIGGEHTISLGSLNSIIRHGKKPTFIHFDAHSDSRDNLFGSKYCHACVVARAGELCDTYSIGVRSVDEQSATKNRARMLFMKDVHKMDTEAIVKSILDHSGSDVYISIDLDVLDPSEMPSVGTPEPDGIKFCQLKEIIKGVAEKKKVLGMDLVELNPIPGVTAPNYLAAKLAYLMIGYSFHSE